jgi:hypothetical protein
VTYGQAAIGIVTACACTYWQHSAGILAFAGCSLVAALADKPRDLSVQPLRPHRPIQPEILKERIAMNDIERASRKFLTEPDMKMFRSLFSEASDAMKSCVDNALIAAFAGGCQHAVARCDAEGHGTPQPVTVLASDAIKRGQEAIAYYKAQQGWDEDYARIHAEVVFLPTTLSR